MTAFKALRDVSVNFESELQRINCELFVAKIGDCFEDRIAKKLRDLSLHTAKLRLLQAKHIAVSPEVQNQPKDEPTSVADYTDSVRSKLKEQQIGKALTQAHVVKGLVTAPDSSLDPDMVERKENIVQTVKAYSEKEEMLMELESVLKLRHQQLAEVRRQWDEQLGLLKESQVDCTDSSVEDHGNPLRSKLVSLEGKIGLMKSLLARLATTRCGNYDWLTDPHRRLRALKLARQS